MLFSGELVRLRSIIEDDLKYAAGYLNDPEIILLLDDDAPIPTSLEKQKEWFAEYLKEKDISKGLELAIETVKERKYIGSCFAHHMDLKNRHTLVGIFIGDREYLGKGYGTEAMMLLMDYLFDEVNLNKISLDVFSFNERAIRSYEKLGFKVEAIGREAVFRFGGYHDLYAMGILREEYHELRKKF
ncbi:MAG TPA: GNAT family protein [Clostridia bacterium]|nr:GNAT family protein [Clostridia bacterium]